jgi:hypothetical protein
MIKKRNRSKPASTFEARVTRFTNNLRREVKTVTPGSAEALELRNRIRKSEHALHLNETLMMVPESSRAR